MDTLFCDFVFRFDFYANLLTKVHHPAKVVQVFDKVKMHGEKGAVATVDMPEGELVWMMMMMMMMNATTFTKYKKGEKVTSHIELKSHENHVFFTTLDTHAHACPTDICSQRTPSYSGTAGSYLSIERLHPK